jgi:hypothetical protein
MPSPKASHSTVKGWMKSGRDKTGHVLITFFILSNVNCDYEIHLKAPFLVKSFKGAQSCEKPLMNLL